MLPTLAKGSMDLAAATCTCTVHQRKRGDGSPSHQSMLFVVGKRRSAFERCEYISSWTHWSRTDRSAMEDAESKRRYWPTWIAQSVNRVACLSIWETEYGVPGVKGEAEGGVLSRCSEGRNPEQICNPRFRLRKILEAFLVFGTSIVTPYLLWVPCVSTVRIG